MSSSMTGIARAARLLPHAVARAAALGATRLRLMRQLLVDSTIISAGGGALGVLGDAVLVLNPWLGAVTMTVVLLVVTVPEDSLIGPVKLPKEKVLAVTAVMTRLPLKFVVPLMRTVAPMP